MQEYQAQELSQQSDISAQRLIKKLYPWLVWGLGAAFFFYKYVLQVSPSVMSTDLMRAFSVTGAGLGNLAACFFYAYLIMQIPVGLMLDRWSPRIVAASAIFLSALGTFLFAHAHNLLTAGMSRALIGFGAAFAAVSCFKLATIWFPPKRFALIAGLSMTAAMLGAVGGEAPLSWLVQNHGWREALVMIALPGFLLTALVLLIVRDKKTEPSITTTTANLSFRQIFPQLKKILQNTQTWWLSIYSGLAFAPVSVFGGLWGVSFLEESYHLTPTSAASAMSLIFVGFAIGCPLAGWLSDYIERRKLLMILGTSVALITIVCVIYFPISSTLLLDFLLLSFGLGASCFFLCFSMIREIHPLLFAATVLGFMNTFDSICEALTEPFVGKLLDLGWKGNLDNGARIFSLHDYHLAFIALPIYLGSALLLLCLIRETFCRQKISD